MANLFLHHYGHPRYLQALLRRALPLWLSVSVLLLAIGLYWAWFVAPVDYLQGATMRIMYVHVPAAWLAMGIYAAMAAASFCYLVWRFPLSDKAALALAPIGAAFAVMTLITGSLWGKPMWGAYWVWDARLTSMLILLILYLGYLSFSAAQEHQEQGRRRAAILALFGALNLPIIKFSVEWWNTLHQPASVIRADGSTIHPSMLIPLLLVFVGLAGISAALAVWRVDTLIVQQKIRRIQLQKNQPSSSRRIIIR